MDTLTVILASPLFYLPPIFLKMPPCSHFSMRPFVSYYFSFLSSFLLLHLLPSPPLFIFNLWHNLYSAVFLYCTSSKIIIVKENHRVNLNWKIWRIHRPTWYSGWLSPLLSQGRIFSIFTSLYLTFYTFILDWRNILCNNCFGLI